MLPNCDNSGAHRDTLWPIGTRSIDLINLRISNPIRGDTNVCAANRGRFPQVSQTGRVSRTSQRRNEDRDLQHQQRQQAPRQPARLAGARRSPTWSACRSSRRRTPSFPKGRDRARRLRRGLARAEILERRRDPRARRTSRSSRAPSCRATRPTSRAATSRRR